MAFEILLLSEVEPYRAVLPLLQEGGRVHRWDGRGAGPGKDVLEAVEGLYVYGHLKVSGAFMDRMPRLKVISNYGVGVDHIDLEAAQQRGIPVGNTPNVLDGATADLTFALLLAGARNVVRGDAFARGPDFTWYDPSFMLGQEVHGRVLGIVGLGNIGFQVGRRARGFDMQILYHNRRRNERAERELGARYCTLDELLKEADFVTLNVPLTAQTRGLIGRRELELMKASAVLVNVARGGVVDHQALFEALQARQIFCAALDVTEPEPLPRDHPLLGLDNVVVLPHLGSATVQTRDAMARRSVDNLRTGLRGEDLPSRAV